MAKRALGLIEVRGYLGAVVAADIAVKAANVSIINIEKIKSGLNTVHITGDVGAVKAAVAAAVAELENKSFYRGSHVIASMDEQTEKLIRAEKKLNKEEPLPVEERAIAVEQAVPLTQSKEEVAVSANLVASPEPSERTELVNEEATETTEVAEMPTSIEEEAVETPFVPKFSQTELEKLKVVKLRSIAYREKDIQLSKKEIKFANKRQLVQALMELSRKE
ncbi:BMC domain-containing protein [Streptococcus suis]|uniref:BMC domain-containing protein n=1 Tax=Streptococcus suis TaxID=1307 RepID=UPI000CF5073B|nr:BMC domain-containing protein [Streptococcus suis]